MTPKELYKELQNPRYSESPFNRKKGWGEDMEIVEEVISQYWRERFLIDHRSQEAYEMMNRNLTLTFLTHDDIDWKGVESLENNFHAYSLSAYYPRFSVGKFSDGVAIVEWTLYPDGQFFMDEDGYGMESCEKSVLYGYIDRKCRVVIPFQASSWKKMLELRPDAEYVAKDSDGRDDV